VVDDLPAGVRRGGERWRAPYALDPAKSRGRLHAEPECRLRSPFQRDRDRVIHSNAFRRLRHKTQVFIRQEDDHYRTRLTHSLEVAQVARSIARPLGLDEDLSEALALAHDLGHPPFGHAGERALARAMEAFGGFDHNAQSLRVVSSLERRYPGFDGLNLTWEALEGLAKHNGPLTGSAAESSAAAAGQLPYAVAVVQRQADLALDLYPSLEAQVAALSDDIAYDAHDLEDGLRSGLLSLDPLESLALTGRALGEIAAAHPGLDRGRTIHALIRRLIAIMIEDAIGETARRVKAAGVASPEEVRRAGAPLCGFSAELAEAEAELKRFLLANLYRSEAVMRPVRDAEELVARLFKAYCEAPARLPEEWRQGLDLADPQEVARRAADYIAGMTDRFAGAEHRRLFDATPELG
jgi:dGTPase